MDSIPQNALDNCDCDPPAAPGIYAIINRINRHVYVGSAKSLIHRKEHHFRDLKAGNHKNHHLQRAYDHYGSDAFCFVVLEAVEHVEDLLAREQHYIDTLNPEYNIARTAGSSLGVKRSPEFKKKISIVHTGRKHTIESRLNMGAPKRGRKQSPEHIAKRSAARIGKKQSPEHAAKSRVTFLGGKHTPEARAKMSEARLGKKRSPETLAKIRETRAAKREARLAQQKANQPPLF